MTPEQRRKHQPAITDEVRDEFLEALWLLGERDRDKASSKPALFELIVAEGVAEDAAAADAMLSDIVTEGHLVMDGDKVTFSGDGLRLAKTLIRRKRLAEKLLAEVLAVGPSEIKAAACKFEHILSPEVTESVCSFLGHPPSCPHGKPIPRGSCCKKLSHDFKPLVMPLSDMDPGAKGKIVFIAPKDHSRMDRLSSLGIVPGTVVALHQKKPAFVIRSGESELALDIEIAGEIYVKEVR